MGKIVDSELEFLSECDNEQLCLLADILVFDPKDKKKRYTETLSKRSSYVAFYPHYMKRLVPDIIDEYRRFVGNAIFKMVTIYNFTVGRFNGLKMWAAACGG